MKSQKPIGPLPEEIKQKLLRKWQRGIYFSRSEELFPLRISLGTIPASVLSDRFEDIRQWIGFYENSSPAEDKPYRIDWKEINHRLFGRNRIPEGLIFENVDDLARFLGRMAELKRFKQLRETLLEAHEKLTEWADSAPFDLLNCSNELDRLIRLWRWMIKNPRPDLYLRQIDLPGIDTKFTETFKRVLSAWLDLTLAPEHVDTRFSGQRHFEDRYGFKKKPELIRIGFLDRTLSWYGCTDITLDSHSFCHIFEEKKSGMPLPPKPEHVFVVENDITALAFPPVPKGMVIFGRGYYFDHWKQADWLNEVNLWYWGDLDTHGFSILNQFREIFPRARSFLMDRKTLLDHESSWVEEKKQSHQELCHLTPEEKSLYDDLRFNRLGKNLRLEQEFIGFNRLQSFLSERADSRGRGSV